MDFKKYLKNLALSESTIKHYHQHTLEFISFLDQDHTEAENCTEKEIMLYLQRLQKKQLSQESKNIRLFALKHYFNYQIETGKREDNPVKNIKLRSLSKQKIYPALSIQELQNFYQQYDTEKPARCTIQNNGLMLYQLCRKRNKIILGLLIYQGVTTAEIKKISVDDLDLRKGTIEIKGGRVLKDRTLELKSYQIVDIMEYLYTTREAFIKYQSKETKDLFLSAPTLGNKTTYTEDKLNIFKRITKELRSQNPKLINLQHLRTSVIMNWLKKYNLRQVQYRAGHKNIYSTEKYLANDIEDLQTEIEMYHPLS